MATLFVPSPHALNAMTTRRAPLANVPNATNSPHRAVSAAATMKRGRPPGLPWDSAPPPLKKQALDAENTDARTPQRTLNQPQTGESKLFTRRTNTQPTAFERKLAAARDKPKQPTTLKVSRNIKYCPESVESVRQWQRHYRKVFPTYVFYFESIPDETRKKYVRQIMSLGAVSLVLLLCLCLFSFNFLLSRKLSDRGKVLFSSSHPCRYFSVYPARGRLGKAYGGQPGRIPRCRQL